MIVTGEIGCIGRKTGIGELRPPQTLHGLALYRMRDLFLIDRWDSEVYK
jgi:hypothetical protein